MLLKRNLDADWNVVVVAHGNAIGNGARGAVAVRSNLPIRDFSRYPESIFLYERQRVGVWGGVRFILGHAKRRHELGRGHLIADGNGLEIARGFSEHRAWAQEQDSTEQRCNLFHGSVPPEACLITPAGRYISHIST